MKEEIKVLIEDSIKVKENFLKNPNQLKILSRVIKEVIKAVTNKRKIIVFGNGGSAADAQHMVAELVGRFKKEREAFNAIALSTNTSTITALANDYGYDIVFVRQLQACVEKGDVVIGISTSGNSLSVIKAIEYAKKIGCITVGLTGRTGGKLKDIVKYCICVPSDDTPRIQETHITLIHIICELVEKKLC